MTELVRPDPRTVDKMVQTANIERSVAEINARIDSEAEAEDAAEAEAALTDEPDEDKDQWVDSAEDWAERSDEHKWIEYRGDRLAIRTPKQSALTSYSMQVSDGSTSARKSKASRQIVENHMSPDSFDRVMDRMGDPDDEFDDDDLSNVVTQILELRTGPLPQPNRAQRRHPTT